MIFEAMMLLLSGVVFLFPDFVPADVAGIEFFNALVAGTRAVDEWINVPAMVSVIVLWVGAYTAAWTVRIFDYFYTRTPGKMT